MTTLAYFLVDADGQETKPRIEIVGEAHNAVHWFGDMASSGPIMALKRPGFGDLHQVTRKGDVLIVPSLDCLGANLTDLLVVLQALIAKGVVVISVREGFHLSCSEGTGIQALLGNA
jgi:DNA invertase Pin-like site-specific DNA recombinase